MRRVIFWSILALCVLASAGALIYPLTVIQPFKHQNQNDLLRALTVFRIAPVTTLVLAVIGIGATSLFWRTLRGRGRIGSSLLVILLCVAAWAARVNVFEQMFHPAGSPRFLAIAEAKLDADDMLIAVASGHEAHAYPVREMGYHHVVNDFVGGTPIVATY